VNQNIARLTEPSDEDDYHSLALDQGQQGVAAAILVEHISRKSLFELGG
jgi:hypothetical protein